MENYGLALCKFNVCETRKSIRYLHSSIPIKYKFFRPLLNLEVIGHFKSPKTPQILNLG